MTNLEFINKEIEITKKQLNKYPLTKEQSDPNYKYKQADIQYIHNKFYTERLQTLQQIKADLEAWEVTKEELQIVFKGKNYYGEPLRRYELNVVGQNKIDTLNKALEVKE